MADPRAAISRARSASESILERQYAEGLRTIQGSEWATDIYNLILNECPNVPEDQVVRLFRRRNAQEAEQVLGEALFREYNATHARRPR